MQVQDSIVIAADPMMLYPTWAYAFEPVEGDARVTESWTDGRTAWPDVLAAAFDRIVTGGHLFADFQRRNITRTLAALNADVEPASQLCSRAPRGSRRLGQPHLGARPGRHRPGELPVQGCVRTAQERRSPAQRARSVGADVRPGRQGLGRGEQDRRRSPLRRHGDGPGEGGDGGIPPR